MRRRRSSTKFPRAGLLLAHHPLLLRGVDTVAASTPKGALVHRLIRTGRSLFTAHTNADSASPGVSDALADALGLTVEAVLEPLAAAGDLDKWVVYVPRENAEAVQAAVFEAGAGQIGDYSHCSWSVTGIGQFLPHDGASPAVGSVGSVERVAEDRFEVVAPARARSAVLAAMRAAHPYEEPAFDIFALVPPPSDAGLGRIGTLAATGTAAQLRIPRRRRVAADILGRARRGRPRQAGVAGRGVRRRRGLAAGRRGRRGRAGLRHGRSAAPSGRRASPGLQRGPDRRRALGKRIPLVRAGRRRAAVPLRSGAAGAGVHHPHRPLESWRRRRGRQSMKAEVAQQRSLLELSKLDAELSRIAHRATHLPQREACERIRTEYTAASDRLGAVGIALEDLDAQVSRFESEIEAVRQREDRDRSMLKSGATDAKQLSDLQHELETLVRRQTSLEDSLLEVMERREELQAQLAVRAEGGRGAADRADRRPAGARCRRRRNR